MHPQVISAVCMCILDVKFKHRSQTAPPECELVNTDVLKSLRYDTTFRENRLPINGLTFSDDGKFLATTSDDETLTVYDCVYGAKERKVCLFLYINSFITFRTRLDIIFKHWMQRCSFLSPYKLCFVCFDQVELQCV